MIITPFLVVFLIVVFILLFLFLNTVDKRKGLTFILSLVLTPLVYFYLLYPFLNIISNYHHQKKFNSEAWLEQPNLRYEMVDYITTSDTLIGQSKNYIYKHLGNFEWLTWDTAKKTHTENKWNYGLGIQPGAFNTKKECLELTFKNNKVVTLRHYQEDITF